MAKVPIMQIWDDATQQYVAIPSIQGAKGDTGFSPTVSISAIPGGHRITITDAAGSQSFDVMDGKSGDGSGDMNAATYDPKGRAQDIFAYADAKQARITASGILKGDGAGGVSAAVKGTDYAAPSVAFTVTLSASGWSDKTQTVSDARFMTNDYAYSVAPDSGSFAAYGKAVIYADNVTTDGQMQFHCRETPTVDLTVNILRMEVSA